MTPKFTPEAAARYIISYFVEKLDCKPNGNLMQQSVAQMISDTFTVSNFNSGIDYAKDQGWIVISSDHRYQLTAAGFSVA